MNDILPLDCRIACWLKAADTTLASLTATQRATLVQVQVMRCLAHARLYWPDVPEPGVWCDLRGKSAGQAHFVRKGVRFNPVMLEEQPRQFIESVVPHEMAHWVVAHLGVREAPHGPVWRKLMQGLYGCTPRVTHRFDTSRASPAPYRYGCACAEHRFSAHRHRRVERGARYQCRRCREYLSYLGCDPTG